MIPKIVQVKPTEEYFALDWRLAIRCNYDCMYCSELWHDNHSRHHDLETMQRAWQSVFDKTQHFGLKYKISFTGGELTTNKHFLPFITWLRNNYDDHLFKVMVTTNGSATYKYYLKMFGLLDNISFSMHSEHIEEKRFFDMVIKLRQNIPADKFLQVVIMDEYWNQERIPVYVRLLESNDISYTINRIDYSLQTRTMPIFKGKLDLEI